jgi:hypothetical protein
MGIGTQAAKDFITALKLAHPGKAAQRRHLEDCINILQTKMAAIDGQLAAAHADFAASKQAQFDNFTDVLPDVGDPLP